MGVRTVKTMTIRNVSPELDRALRHERARRGTSLNQTVLDLLGQRLGVGGVPTNGLARLAGTWDAHEHEQLEETISAFEKVDPDVWR
jgi:plasmid stability protein